MDRNREIAGHAFLKIVALQHAGDRVAGGEPDHVGGRKRIHPFAVVGHGGLTLIQNFEHLFQISVGVRFNFLGGETFSGFRFSRRVSDHAGEITDQKDGLMAEILKLLHLLQQNRVAKMKVRRRGVEARLDSKRTACFNGFLQLQGEFFFINDFGRPSVNNFQLFLNGKHFRKIS